MSINSSYGATAKLPSLSLPADPIAASQNKSTVEIANKGGKLLATRVIKATFALYLLYWGAKLYGQRETSPPLSTPQTLQECLGSNDQKHCNLFLSENGWAPEAFASWEQCRQEFNQAPEACDQFITEPHKDPQVTFKHVAFGKKNTRDRYGKVNLFSRWKKCVKEEFDIATCNLFLGKGKWSEDYMAHIKTDEIAIGWSDYLYSRLQNCVQEEHSVETCKQFLERKNSFYPPYSATVIMETPSDLYWNDNVKSEWDKCLKTNTVKTCNKFIVKSPMETTPWEIPGVTWNKKS